MRTTPAARAAVDTRSPRRESLPTRVAAVLLVCAASSAGVLEATADVAKSTRHEADAQLAELVATLLDQNPEVESAREISLSLRERVSQQRSLPDPGVTYRYFAESTETRVGPQRQAVEISQAVPWFGKREQQARRAEHEATGAAWRARGLELDRVAGLKRSYFEAAHLQEALTVNAEEAELLRRFERIALARYSAGQGIQQAVIKIQTEISRLADREAGLRKRLDAAVRHIAWLTGRQELPLHLRSIRLRLPALDLDPAVLESAALREHPGVRAVEEEIRADEAWRRRRTLDSRPDFRFGVGYVEVERREDAAGLLNPPEDNGQDSWALSVGLRVPLRRKRIRAGVTEAARSVRSGEHLLDETRNRLRYAVRESIDRVESSAERARLYADVIIPQAEQSLASAEAAYTTGRRSVLELLDAERVLFQARLAHHRLLADHWIALADLERALGRSFPPERSEP